VNSTIACALVAAKLGVKVAHVEAGLRSFNRSMPEEINRVLTDAISDLLFVSERAGIENLKREGIPDERVHFVGNVMIDTLLKQREKARESPILDRLGLRSGEYGVLTLHRPSNVDCEATLRRILSAVSRISAEIPIVFPVHPRTRARLKGFGFGEDAPGLPGLKMVPPLGYLEFLRLQSEARLILTDSGGLQEEATVLGVPCLTLRSDTERPVTLLHGTNVLVGTDPERILEEARKAIRGEFPIPDGSPELWDGQAAKRIVDVLKTLPAVP
jgi:UDP-N-acetylglucosamine 2-epimerase (non-hydrolysing)